MMLIGSCRSNVTVTSRPVTTEARGATAKDAFDSAVREAQYDYGHAGYTGTIAEKDEFTVISDAVGMTRTMATALAEKLLRDGDKRIDDKWGPAGVIRFGEVGQEPGWLFFGWASS
jgi:hypothetical protein